MLHLLSDFSLKELNTFHLPATAKYFLNVDSAEEIIPFFEKNKSLLDEKRLFLGGGSNLLFISNFDGLILHPTIPGIQIVKETNEQIYVEAGAGVMWDQFVAYCVENGWYGLENLSLIPGNIGAIPVQNIGAYGVEAESVISTVKGIDLKWMEFKTYEHDACEFNYRNSLFKCRLKENFMVTSVVFHLSKQPLFILNYGALESEVKRYGEINLTNVRRAVISIRESKLPDPAITGNAGSFFKNPLVSEAFASQLKLQYPEIPLYTSESGKMKVAAGWLIQNTGWKGRSMGKAAVHDQQALVIINKGGASGKEILDLSERIKEDVFNKFNIQLEKEVQVVGDYNS